MALITVPLVTMPSGDGSATSGCRYHDLIYHAFSYRALWETDQQPRVQMPDLNYHALSSYSNVTYQVPTVM